LTLHLSLRAPRRILAAALGLSLAVGIAACSSDDHPSDAATSSDAQQSDLMPAAEGKTQYPLTLETPWGKTELKERPEKVIAATPSGFDAELLVALGVTPVAAGSGLKNAAYVLNAGGDKIETRLDGTGDKKYPLEQMSAMEPDVVVDFGDDLTDDYRNLSAIAPVISAKNKSANYYNDPWQNKIRILGKALDLSDRAEEVITENENLLKKVRDDHPEFKGKTATYSVWYSGSIGLSVFSTPGSPSEEFFTDIGFSKNPLSAETEGKISPEQYGLTDADALIVSDSTGDKNDLASLTDNPLYKAVPAVKDGHVSYIDEGADKNGRSALAWALALMGPIGTSYVVDNLVPKLDEALNAS
jgi:iron complex transport system substrate-binding protein